LVGRDTGAEGDQSACRPGRPQRTAAIVTDTNVNPLAVSSGSVWLKEAAFFDYFLCSRKESDPPAGEAVTE
jgi:hypothetical protein